MKGCVCGEGGGSQDHKSAAVQKRDANIVDEDGCDTRGFMTVLISLVSVPDICCQSDNW